jgi:hypothetical protein
MGLSAGIQVSSTEVSATSAYKTNRIGAEAYTADGRQYRYILNGAVALAAGKTVNAIARIANHTTITVQTPAAIGDQSVKITLGATLATADQYADGFLVVKDSTGVGQTFGIAGNTATASAGVITVFLKEPIVTALTTSSIVSLVNNPWNAVVVAPAAAAEFVVGVPQVPIAASVYGWVQTGGIASVLSDGIITKGAGAIQSASVIGAATIELAATVTQRIGLAPEATVDTKYDPLYLQIDQ